MTAIEVWRVEAETDGGFGAPEPPPMFTFAADRDRFLLRRGARRALLAGRDSMWSWSASSTPGEVVVALARGTEVGVDVERGLKLLGVGLARPPATVDALVPAARAFAALSAPEPVWVRDLPGERFAALACTRRPARLRIIRATARGGTLEPLEEVVHDE
jgi:hypothetical protein